MSIYLQEQSRKCLRFHIQGQAYQFKALPFGLPTAPFEFTMIPKEVKLMAIYKVLRSHQYLDDWLVRTSSHQACLQHTQELVNNVSATRLAGELREIRAGAQTRLQFYRLPVRPQIRLGPADSRSVADPSGENAETAIPTGLPGPGIHVLDRFANSYRKASSSRPTSYETHSVASQTQLEGPRITGKGDPNPQVLAPLFTMRAEGRQCPYSPTITPNKACFAIFTEASIEGWGAHLDEHFARATWSPPGSKLHINYLEL